MVKKVLIFLLMQSLVISFPLGSFGAPVHVPGRPLLNAQITSESPANITLEGDFVTDRKLQEDARITRANWINLKATGIFLGDRVQPYILLGSLLDGEFKQEVGGANIKYITEDAFTWGAGTTILVHKITDRLGLGLDVKYRQTNPTVGKVKIDGVNFSRDDDNVSLDCNYQEWQAALGLCGLTENFLGYGGIKYSDVRTLLKARAGGIDTKKTLNSANKVGVFLGCEFIFTENVTIGLEGRFIDEQSYTFFMAVHF
jgi:opacity protein-like surface antigen